jgi:glucan phosphoethanolaminetransferase (alkaline phosphatase superfamily)
MFKKYTLNRLLVVTATAGFAFLLADTLIEHFATFSQEIMSFIPPVFSLIGLIIGLITVYKWKPGIIRIMHIFLFLSFVVAAAGFYYHVAEEEDDENLTVEERLHEENEKDKPLLAPLAFGGIAVVGLLGTYRKWESEKVEN